MEDEAEQGRREKQAEADGVQEPAAVMLERESQRQRQSERESESERESGRRVSEYLCREVLGGVVRVREAAEELRVEVEEEGVRAAAAQQRCTHDAHLAVTLALLEHRVMGLEAEKEEATREKEEATRSAQLQVFV